jgi:hypothetical protein
MHEAERIAMGHGWLDADRDDPRLFTQGPPDRFETLAQRSALEVSADANSARETVPEPVVAADPYWRMETLPVNDPGGESLGHALHMLVFPHIAQDPEQDGAPAIPADVPFRMLEVAHFETTEAADRFWVAFQGYLVPGLLDGPELAEEVARLEGLPAEWKTLDGQELEDYRDFKLTLTRDPADWQPYNPSAERDARIEAEGLYTDPIHPFTTFDEEKDDPKVKPDALDLDL